MFLEIEQVKAWHTISWTTLLIKHHEHKKQESEKVCLQNQAQQEVFNNNSIRQREEINRRLGGNLAVYRQSSQEDSLKTSCQLSQEKCQVLPTRRRPNRFAGMFHYPLKQIKI